MTDTTEVVRKLTITATQEGVAGTTDAVNKLAQSITNVAEVTDTSSKQQLSAQGGFDKLTRSLTDGAAAHAKYESGVKIATTALNQGVITQTQYAATLDLLKKKYGEGTEGAGSFSKAIEAIKDRLNEFQGNAGLVGQIVSSFGVGGIAAAVGIGVLIEAFNKLSEAAAEQGQWARQLTQTAETLELNTTQLQALNEKASQAGLTSDQFTTSLFRMQQQIAQLKQGTGTLWDELSKGNQALRNQLSNAKDAATQIDILAKAYANASSEQQKLITRGFGRGGSGAAFGRVLQGINEAGGTTGAVDENAPDAATQAQIKEWNDLSKAIASATESAKHNFASIFTTDILTSEKQFAEGMLNISRWAREFAFSDDFKKFEEWLTSPLVLGALAALAAGVAIATGPVGIAVAGAAVAAGAITYGIGAAGSSSAGSSRNFDQTFSDVQQTHASEGPPAPSDAGQPNLAGRASDAAKLVTELGAAATAQEKYTAAVLKAQSLEENGTITKSTANRVISNAALERATSLEQAHNAALGASASVSDVVEAKRLSLQKLQQQGAGLTNAEIANQLRITQSQALGTYQIDQQTTAEQVKIDTFGMSTKAATAYATAQTLINKAMADGKPLTDAEVEAIKNSANAYAAAKQKADDLKATQDTLRSSAVSFTSDLISGLRSGESLMSSLGNAARNLSTSLTNGALNNLFSGNYVAAGVEGIGAVISGIFGDDEAEKEKQKQQQEQAQQAALQKAQDDAARVTQFNEEAQAAALDTNTVYGQLQAFDIQATQQRADEAAKGNAAIVALENDLAVQRKAIVDKANQAIEKSLTDFLNSIKTGSLSTLSPEDQLKAAQSQFNSDVTGGHAGNETALNNITKDAQSLLSLAQAFYASGTGYATVYQSVTDAISNIASGSNPLGLANGGRVPGMAGGGIVGNGVFGVDSVVASYASGGNIALAGGEYVTKSTSVNSSTLGALQYINRTGKSPNGDNSEVVRVLTQGFNGQTAVLADKLDTLADRIKRLEDTTRQTSTQRRVPGSNQKAA